MIYTKLYLRLPKDSLLDPAELVKKGEALAWDFLDHPNGDKIGVIHTYDGGLHRALLDQHNIPVLPPLHRPIKSPHVSAFSEYGAIESDFGYDVAEKLYQHFKMPWMHPESPR